MVTTAIPIEGTFDIAKGRSSLRTHIAVHRWPPVFDFFNRLVPIIEQPAAGRELVEKGVIGQLCPEYPPEFPCLQPFTTHSR